ncbi:beta-ketoacyl-[acyl-carrier-protein] synthase family protein [Salinactinospora qingdaonensis]|uniref:Beta-ketoacyl-[acyl-carrier-protein] synthase family protein n=1 Tax=Salinactinospora qingdaonensis TaxID=702744 RepID=A0ABP7F928_9ACTN
MQRVVVTGLGTVSSIGIGVDEFREGLRSGRSGISPIASFDTTGFPHVHGGEVPDFVPEKLLRRLRPHEWGRASQFAASAARLAVEDANLADGDVAPERAGTVMGTTSGESQVVEALTAEQVNAGLPGMSAGLLRQVPASRLANSVSAELGFAGESMTVATACSASNYALGYAYDLIATGEADVMVAGGADAVCRWAHAGFYRLGALTERVCSPFDQDRSGILTGEGGVALVLESMEHALARGVRPHAEMLGYGLNCDANHMVSPDADSIAACMVRAHTNAGITPADVDYISAHGTGTPANDLMEAQAVLQVFGDTPPPMSSIKSMLGHTMGAASGFGAVASTLAITEGFLPPTMNWSTPDPDMSGIDPVPNTARSTTVNVAQNNGFAFGGNNAIILLGAVT